ncbi:MAG: prepilin-type N-terminal cleavage/methylation domain-containing protein [bacterium]|nr:prepilin-type N-terminal cleavage/methylation domain-containing protein [bacterium]
MIRGKNKLKFTLIEVIVAIAILSMGLVGAMAISGSSKRRVDKAYNRWRAQHILTQAGEYYLLCGPNIDIPNDIFPYSDVRASCNANECENLPNNLPAQIKDWSLFTYNIKLTGTYNINVMVDKIVHSTNTSDFTIEKINSN